MLLAGAWTFAGDANNGTTMPHNKSNAGVQRLQQRPKRAKRSLAIQPFSPEKRHFKPASWGNRHLGQTSSGKRHLERFFLSFATTGS
jgi:hypothetical protein